MSVCVFRFTVRVCVGVGGEEGGRSRQQKGAREGGDYKERREVLGPSRVGESFRAGSCWMGGRRGVSLEGEGGGHEKKRRGDEGRVRGGGGGGGERLGGCRGVSSQSTQPEGAATKGDDTAGRCEVWANPPFRRAASDARAPRWSGVAAVGRRAN